MREDSKEAKENQCDFIKGDHHILIRFVSQRNIKTFVGNLNIENDKIDQIWSRHEITL